jgi:hypothetical protein
MPCLKFHELSPLVEYVHGCRRCLVTQTDYRQCEWRAPPTLQFSRANGEQQADGSCPSCTCSIHNALFSRLPQPTSQRIQSQHTASITNSSLITPRNLGNQSDGFSLREFCENKRKRLISKSHESVTGEQFLNYYRNNNWKINVDPV